MRGSRLALALVLAVAGVALAQQALISRSNFGGADEWLLLDLASRGIFGVPYAHRPLVLLWQALPAQLWPGSLTAFWAAAGLYRLATGLLTFALALRLAPGRRRLALTAAACAVAWTPLDQLRHDTVLICGYEGVTFATLAALVLWVESWHRRSPWLLASGGVLAAVAALCVESVVPVLALAPLVCWRPPPGEARRFAAWALAWETVVVLMAAHAALPLLTGQPSYQAGALGLDPSPLRTGARLLQLFGMQLEPLLTAALDLQLRAVAPAVLAFAAGYATLCLRADDDGGAEGQLHPLLRMLAIGLALAAAAHLGFALTPVIRTSARTQILSGPGFAIALAAAIALATDRLARPGRAWLAGAAAAWIVACGTARVAAIQQEWDNARSSYLVQARGLAALTSAAPSLRPGTLVLLLDERGSWPLTFSFLHAVRYLYGDGVVGAVHGASDFLYQTTFTSAGVLVAPNPVIRREWQVQPTLHPWEAIVVARQRVDGTLAILPRWPGDRLPALPPGAAYAPEARIAAMPVRELERRVLAPAGEAARR